MSYYSGNINHDIAVYNRDCELAERNKEPDYKCCACGEGFYSGFGSKIHDEHFCTPCVKALDPVIDFYRAECGLDDRTIYEQLAKQKSI